MQEWKTWITGKRINYELATPIEEDITDQTELNNSLPCNDYGIESKSDDVICGMRVLYQMNAKRTIFNNKTAIEDLKQRVTALENQLPSTSGLDTTKTYALKVVNGVYTLVEETNE